MTILHRIKRRKPFAGMPSKLNDYTRFSKESFSICDFFYRNFGIRVKYMNITN